MARYLVVGSGATGVHCAQTLLERGYTVDLVDVGYPRPTPVHPAATFPVLKEQAGAEAFFLGRDSDAVVYPGPDAKPYGFPPSKHYVFRRPRAVRIEERGFSPLVSFARGGLAEAWTGGSYELRDEELADFPFTGEDLRPCYAHVATRIGIAATADDLQATSPLSAPYLESLAPDPHSAALLARYQRRRDKLNAAGFVLGRSRVAVLSRELGERHACSGLGRCLWGCPRGSLYAPSQTLAMLLPHPKFVYHPGLVVRRVMVGGGGVAGGVVVAPAEGGSEAEIRADRVILAAGALATSEIFLRTLAGLGQPDAVLPGLMDNRQALIPFLSLGRAGAAVELDSYQFHMLAIGLRGEDWRTDVHGQISTLKAAAVHPIVAGLPFDTRTALTLFRRLRGGLGVANIWLADSRREGNRARLGRDDSGRTCLVLEYGDHDHDRSAGERAVARTRQALGQLGCLAPRAMAKLLPRGSSVHYAGTLPMGVEDREHTTRADGSVRGFPGLHVVDGAGFPWLPAKNLTFTLMANATRIASLLD